MRQMNFTINDDDAEKLEKIKTSKHFANNADAISWIIQHVFASLFKDVVT